MEKNQLSEALEHRSDDNIGDNDHKEMSEELLKLPAIETNNEDIEFTHNDVEHFHIIEDTAADSGGEGKLSEVKVYALCCALVVLYKLYNLNM